MDIKKSLTSHLDYGKVSGTIKDKHGYSVSVLADNRVAVTSDGSPELYLIGYHFDDTIGEYFDKALSFESTVFHEDGVSMSPGFLYRLLEFRERLNKERKDRSNVLLEDGYDLNEAAIDYAVSSMVYEIYGDLTSYADPESQEKD